MRVKLFLRYFCKNARFLQGLSQVQQWVIYGLFYYLENYFNILVCLSFCRLHPVLSHFQFLQSFHKMALMKFAWHVLRVKNM